MDIRENRNSEESRGHRENQTDVLSSSLDQEELDIRDLLQSLKRKKKILMFTAGLIFCGSLFYTIYSRVFNPVYRGSFSILISDPMTPGEKQSSETSSSLFEDIAINKSTYETETLITVLKSQLFLEDVASEFDLNYKSLSSKISINQNSAQSNKKAQGILNVNLVFNNKEKGKLILDKLAETYLQVSLIRRQQKLQDGLQFLTNQAPEIQKKKNELQANLVTFREKNKLIEPKKEGDLLKVQQKSIESQILELEADRNRLKTITIEIKNGSVSARGFKKEMDDGLSISDFNQSLLQQLISVEAEIAKAKSKYTSNSNVVKGLELRLTQIQPILLKDQLKAVSTALKLNQARLDSLYQQKEVIEEKFVKHPALIKQYQDIEQKLDIANKNLLSLVSARETFQLEMAQNNTPWRIISNPQMDNNPIKPSFIKNLSAGALIGLLTGSVLAYIRDKKDHVFHSAMEVKEEFKFPLLGHIPHVNIFQRIREEKNSILDYLTQSNNSLSKSNSKVDNYQRFFYQEAFRNFYTSIRFLSGDEKINTLLVTSSLPKEGKSLINILLAKTLADMGERILLIDADMRKPTLHFRLAQNNLIGLSNLLTDASLSFEEVTKPVQGINNLDIIPGGTTPPDPTRLLSSKRFSSTLDEIKESKKYDMILFDSPPVIGLADSILISDKVDGVILLIGLDVIDRDLPGESINRIKSMGSNLYGLVTNCTLNESGGEFNRYGSYGYKYSYGGASRYEYNPSAIYETYSNDEKEKSKDTKEVSKFEKINKKDKSKLFYQTLIKKLNIFLNWIDS